MQPLRMAWKWTAVAAWMVAWSLVCAPAARADEVTLLAADSAAATARFDLITAARHEIDLAYFIVDDDSFSSAFLEALRKAARRGVRVRMVVDGFGSVLPIPTQAALVGSGIQLREYHQPRLLLPDSITNRLHDKYLARDRVEIIVGGRNMKDSYFGRAPAGHRNYLDLDLRIRGKVATNSKQYFDALWNSPEVRPITPGRFLSRSAPQLMNSLRLRWAPAVARQGPVEIALSDTAPMFAPLTIPSNRIQFIYDPAGRKDNPGGVQANVCRLLNSARQSIVLETPYFVPTGQFDRVLRGALERHVRVIVLTNSLETTDHQIVYPAYRDRVVRYLNDGAEIWEYHGPDTLHAKMIVVDQRSAAVTSFNFDPRSANLDTQTGIVIHDRRFANQVLHTAQPHFDAAVPVNRVETQSQPIATKAASAWPRRAGTNLGPLRLQALRMVSRAIVPHL